MSTDSEDGGNRAGARPRLLVVDDDEAIVEMLVELLERDGRVRLQVAPEVHYGKYQTRWTRSSQGIERGAPSRLKRTLEPMTIQTTLSGGEMLIIGSRAELPGSLGHRFLTRDVDGRLEQALLVIRLAQTQHEDLFDPQQPLPLDMVADVGEEN